MLDGQRLAHPFDQAGGVGAVGRALPVVSDRSRRGGVGDERATAAVHVGEAVLTTTGRAGKGAVAAGVEDKEVEAAAAVFHGVEDVAAIQCFVFELRFVLYVFQRVHRDEVVGTVVLHAMPGIVKQRDGIAVQAGSKGLYRLFHRFLAGVFQSRHAKPRRL